MLSIEAILAITFLKKDKKKNSQTGKSFWYPDFTNRPD
jgi:hypothetical protein